MVLIGARPSALFLFLQICSIASAQLVGVSNVFSARIENADVAPDRASIRITIKNAAERPITAFSMAFSYLNPDGERIQCGGRGADMIDWSDAMPGRNIYVHMRRNWIPPGRTTTFEGFPQCPDGQHPIETIQVELNLIMFDDGTGEGDARQIELALHARQEAARERLRWVPRISALRSASDLKASAASLYRDLVEATRSADIDPNKASQQGMAKPVREELQRLALEITESAAHNEPLQKSEFLEWRITDLEERTARLVKGAGKMAPN